MEIGQLIMTAIQLKGDEMKTNNNKIKIEMEFDTKGMGMEIGQLIHTAIQLNKNKKMKIRIYSELPLDNKLFE